MWPEPGKGLGGAHEFAFMINLKILELWGLNLGAHLEQRLSTSKLKRRHSVTGIWAWGRDSARGQMGVGVLDAWVLGEDGR